MNTPQPTPTPITAITVISSFAGFSAAWMVVMATRYYALQGSDINGAVGVGIDTGSWLSTAYSVCEPIGVVIGAWLGIALSLRRMLLTGVVVFLIGTIIPLILPSYDAYQQTVLQAFGEVEDALSSQRAEELHYQALTAQLADNAQALLEAQQRYRRGQEGLLPVLEDQQLLYATQDARLTSALTRCLADISLFKALGGYWQEGALGTGR